MSEFKGTPGPWSRDGNMVYSLQNSDSKFTDKENRFYAGFYRGRNCSADELSANTQIAMTAPEMLKILQLVLQLQTRGFIVLGDHYTSIINDVVKKVLGEA